MKAQTVPEAVSWRCLCFLVILALPLHPLTRTYLIQLKKVCLTTHYVVRKEGKQLYYYYTLLVLLVNVYPLYPRPV